ncbi:MAG: RNA polymerase sigma factor [Lachnospiraceae bacterium]|nr:RNA polymerase sigma factor [Lachnospiraceae bacterium]
MLFLMMLIESEEDRSKMGLIYKLYHNYMYAIAADLLNSRSDAEDAAQEAFIRIIGFLDGIIEPKCLKTKHLCVIIVKRIAFDMLRRRRAREKDTDPELIDELYDSPKASEMLEAVEDHSDLAAAMKALPDRYREAVLLRYSDEYSFEEIAQILDISEANARKLVQRAVNKLRDAMEGKHASPKTKLRMPEAKRKEVR